MFIQTDTLPDPDALRFVPGEAVLPSGKAEFPDPESSRRSPLARRLFAIDGVTGVSLEPDSVTVGKRDDKDWHVLKPAIFRAIMEHFASGRPAVRQQSGEAAPGAEDPDGVIAAELMDFLNARIRPTVADEGGNVAFAGFADGVLTLELAGAPRRRNAPFPPPGSPGAPCFRYAPSPQTAASRTPRPPAPA